MQLIAEDDSKKIIYAENAHKERDYVCLECKTLVRVRGGLHRRKHFFHLSSQRKCRLNGKSLIHLQVQWMIQNLLPDGEAFLEHRFTEIDRIADVCWEKERIVFEIQCSPMSLNELQARNASYQKIGYQVVWILHDMRYNSKIVSEIEKFLVQSPHYYTNIDAEGQGVIYDQIHCVSDFSNRGRGEPVPVNLANLFWVQNKRKLGVFLEARQNSWPVYFQGDLLDQAYRGKLSEQNSDALDKIDKEKLALWFDIAAKCYRSCRSGYQFVFNLLLETCSK